MKKQVLSLFTALALATTVAAPASAACMKGCTKVTVDADYGVGSIAAAGGISGGWGIIKQKNYSETGTVNEADLTVKIDANGVKKIDGTFRSAGYGVNTSMVRASGASGAISASGVTGGMDVNVKVKKTGK